MVTASSEASLDVLALAGANRVLRLGHMLGEAEGLEVFRVPVPAWLAGRSLAQVDLRTRTGCNVIGVVPRGAGRVQPPPDPHAAVPADASLVVIGDAEAQARFYAAGR